MEISEYERQIVMALKEVARLAQLAYWRDRQECLDVFRNESCSECRDFDACRATAEFMQHMAILDIIED